MGDTAVLLIYGTEEPLCLTTRGKVARNPVSQSIRVCRCRAPSSGYHDFFGGSNLLLCV